MFIFGPDVRSLGLTIFLIVAPVTVFCIFVARKLMDDFSHHLGISVMVAVVAFTIYVSLFHCSHKLLNCLATLFFVIVMHDREISLYSKFICLLIYINKDEE